MKVKELKEQLAKMNDDDEVDAALPINLFLTGEQLKEKRVYLVSSFPKEGIPISNFFGGDVNSMINFFDNKEIFITNQNINDEICNIMDEWDFFSDLPTDYTHIEVR